ncbi:MAG: rhomboid family intramembrane serine protease [Bradymonadia bacterium]
MDTSSQRPPGYTPFDPRLEAQRRFFQQMRDARPRATWLLAALVVLVTGASMLWGGFDERSARFNLVLELMGSVRKDAILEGEYWRLLSGTLLHGGVVHVLMNLYGLVMLGKFVEPILGRGRMLMLYVLSALVGALGSAFLGEGASVGASGAIWGFMGAIGGLVVRPGGLIPGGIAKAIGRRLMPLLILNVAISFLPRVDFYAHFLGGAAGFALTFTGLLRPRPGEPPDSLASWGLGALALLTLAGSGAMATVQGEPWQLGQPVFVKETRIADTGLTLPLPGDLPAPQREGTDSALTLKFGELQSTPDRTHAVTVGVDTLTAHPAQRRQIFERDIQHLEQTLKQRSRLLGVPRRDDGTGAPFWTVERDLGGAKSQMFVSLLEDRIVVVEVVWLNDFRAAVVPTLSALTDRLAPHR